MATIKEESIPPDKNAPSGTSDSIWPLIDSANQTFQTSFTASVSLPLKVLTELV